MYRINDKPAAIRRVQDYLITASNPDIFVAPTGIFDENTRLSVIDFQKKHQIDPTGVVDLVTFNLLFDEYTTLTLKDEINRTVGSFVDFPIRPEDMLDEILHINQSMARLLDYYGITHRLQNSSFYSEETSAAVRELRHIYSLEDVDYIDEIFYFRMINDHNSIYKLNNL